MQMLCPEIRESTKDYVTWIKLWILLPSLPEFYMPNYMPICSFWTGLINGPALFPGKVNVTFTNSIVKLDDNC